MTFTSYASNFEDVLLNRVFGDIPAGRYIDIGAAHPTYASTTKAFYDRGWSGLNVEPGPEFETLTRERPRDINVCAAVADREGEAEFFINEDLLGTSSLTEPLHPNLSARISRRSKRQVRVTTLDRLIEAHMKDVSVNFLKIDVEGAEREIVLSTDWRAFRPQLIVAEATEPYSTRRVDAEWAAHLAQNGYGQVYFDGINSWFLRREDAALVRLFEFPVNQLDDFVVFDPEKEWLRGRVAELERNRLIAPKLTWLGNRTGKVLSAIGLGRNSSSRKA